MGFADPGLTKNRLISQSELRAHRSATDAWIVVDGNVYDITLFLDNHPGGGELILNNLDSQDVGQLMKGLDNQSDHAHSKSAFEMLEQFYVGTLEENNRPPREVDSGTTDFHVDLNKPLVFQVGHLAEKYQEWVHKPILSKETPRFFENKICESLTRTRWWVVPLVWLPVIFWTQVIAVQRGLPTQELAFPLIGGIFIWTLIEYVMHRFLFHVNTRSYWGNAMHYALHGCHHKYPMDGLRLVFPPAGTAGFCCLFWPLVKALFRYEVAPSFMGGGLLGYVMYDVTHYYLHHGVAMNGATRELKRYHLGHHFKIQNRGFGITSPLWDWVFQTLPNSK